ncbi:hypothetical protein LXA43DRAFT_353883 [Ganoderma leucocontextum]|nr:hypothetical protein LXA43DRAFT_353883 [Ganoderma leucocontextum]
MLSASLFHLNTLLLLAPWSVVAENALEKRLEKTVEKGVGAPRLLPHDKPHPHLSSAVTKNLKGRCPDHKPNCGAIPTTTSPDAHRTYCKYNNVCARLDTKGKRGATRQGSISLGGQKKKPVHRLPGPADDRNGFDDA